MLDEILSTSNEDTCHNSSQENESDKLGKARVFWRVARVQLFRVETLIPEGTDGIMWQHVPKLGSLCSHGQPCEHKRQEEETLLKEQKRREKEEAETRKQHKITFPISVSTNYTSEF